jgi:hypothetical protein
MKLLYCQFCQDVVRPPPQPNVPRACACGRYVVWLTDIRLGAMRIFSRDPDRRPDGSPRHVQAWVLHVKNAILTVGENRATAAISESVGGNPLTEPWFKEAGLIVRSRPGQIGDVAWAAAMPTYAG